MSKIPFVALAGSPNCGKTSLFNLLTGSHQRVGNYPGITVEKKIGFYEADNSVIEFIDLPGTYSLDTRTLDERVAKNIILAKDPSVKPVDVIAAVVDSTNLERSLYLVMELKRIGIPMVVVLNLWDLSLARGQELDLVEFEKQLGVPVVATSAKSGDGIDILIQKIQQLANVTSQKLELDPQIFRYTENIRENFKQLDLILKNSLKKKISPDTLTKKIDQVVMHPVFGPIIMLIVLTLMFQAIFSWASPFADAIESGVAFLAEKVSLMIGHEVLRSFIVDGVITGVGNVFVFLPQIIFLFLFILVLEDIGYLGRAALMLDGIMRKVGLPGKAVVPLLSSHACAVPGIMATRSIDNEKDRLTTMLIAPLTTCSARLPVYTLLIAAIVPNKVAFGFIKWPGLIMMGLFAIGIISSFAMAFILKRTVLTGSASLLLLELPGYRIPSWRNVVMSIIQRVKVFCRKAGTVILLLSVTIWFLVTFPKGTNPDIPQVEQSYAAQIGKTMAPLFAPVGFDWRLSSALIPSFGAREVVVSALSTVLSVQGDEESENFQTQFTEKVVEAFGIPSLISLLVWFIFAPQCISTIAIFKRESGGAKWTWFMVGYTFALAYFFSFIAYRIALSFY